MYWRVVLRMVVACSEVAVASQAVCVAAHDQYELGVGLVAHDPVHDVRAGFLQPVRERDVVGLLEARQQLDDDRHLLAGAGGGDQRIDDR